MHRLSDTFTRMGEEEDQKFAAAKKKESLESSVEVQGEKEVDLYQESLVIEYVVLIFFKVLKIFTEKNIFLFSLGIRINNFILSHYTKGFQFISRN